MSALKLCTGNVNGVHTPVNRKNIFTYLKRECVDVALLQETHSEHLKLQQGGFGQVYFSSFTSRSRGMATLIQRNVPFKLIDCTKDTAGCYVIVLTTVAAGSGGTGGAAAAPTSVRREKMYEKYFAQFINSLWIFWEMIFTHVGYCVYFGF